MCWTSFASLRTPSIKICKSREYKHPPWMVRTIVSHLLQRVWFLPLSSIALTLPSVIVLRTVLWLYPPVDIPQKAKSCAFRHKMHMCSDLVLLMNHCRNRRLLQPVEERIWRTGSLVDWGYGNEWMNEWKQNSFPCQGRGGWGMGSYSNCFWIGQNLHINI